jgi:hypothetical protein
MGFRGERSLGEDLSKDREEEGYLQNLPSTLKGSFCYPSLLGIPSIGSLTGAWLTLKALYEIG